MYRKLSISAFHKSDQKLIASIIHTIPDHMFDSCVSRWQVLTISKIEWSKSWKVYFEAIHRKLKFKVPSRNVCNKTGYHRSPSVCDELLNFTFHFTLHRMSDSAMLYLQIALALYQSGLIGFQTTDDASRVHFYRHSVDFWTAMWMSRWSAVYRAKTWDGGIPECGMQNAECRKFKANTKTLNHRK